MDIGGKTKELEQQIEHYKKLCARSQFLVDEGLEIMVGIKECLQQITNAIRLHKFSIEDGKNYDECNQELWDILEDGNISQW